MSRLPRSAPAPSCSSPQRSAPLQERRRVKAISDLAASDGFTGKKAMEISKKFDTIFPVSARSSYDMKGG
jgi:hypothetical protein